jgi:hypothetical protein
MSNQNVPCRCGICKLVFPTRSELCKHKYSEHKINPVLLNQERKICRTCGQVFSSNSEILTHKLTIHREEFFNGIKSGPKLGAKFSTEHKHKISKALRIHYGSYDPNIPLGPIISYNPQAINERWCHDYMNWMNAVKRRDKQTCQHCGKGKEAYLIAHHIKPYREFIEYRYDVGNGLTLCMSCHMKEEARLKKLRKDVALFLYQLVLSYKDLPKHPEILSGIIGKICFQPLKEDFRRTTQKKYPYLSNEQCYNLIDSFQIEGN